MAQAQARVWQQINKKETRSCTFYKNKHQRMERNQFWRRLFCFSWKSFKRLKGLPLVISPQRQQNCKCVIDKAFRNESERSFRHQSRRFQKSPNGDPPSSHIPNERDAAQASPIWNHPLASWMTRRWRDSKEIWCHTKSESGWNKKPSSQSSYSSITYLIRSWVSILL